MLPFYLGHLSLPQTRDAEVTAGLCGPGRAAVEEMSTGLVPRKRTGLHPACLP